HREGTLGNEHATIRSHFAPRHTSVVPAFAVEGKSYAALRFALPTRRVIAVDRGKVGSQWSHLPSAWGATNFWNRSAVVPTDRSRARRCSASPASSANSRSNGSRRR